MNSHPVFSTSFRIPKTQGRSAIFIVLMTKLTSADSIISSSLSLIGKNWIEPETDPYIQIQQWMEEKKMSFEMKGNLSIPHHLLKLFLHIDIENLLNFHWYARMIFLSNRSMCHSWNVLSHRNCMHTRC